MKKLLKDASLALLDLVLLFPLFLLQPSLIPISPHQGFDFSAYNLTESDILAHPELLAKILQNCTTIPDLNGTAVNCSVIWEEIEGILSQGK